MTAAAILGGCGDDGAADQPQTADDLRNRTFHSTNVDSKGGPAFDEPVTVGFPTHDGKTAVGWAADCNSAGADVEITADELLLQTKPASTDIGCPKAQYEQDQWLADFFASGPRWTLDGSHLELTADTGTIELEAKNSG